MGVPGGSLEATLGLLGPLVALQVVPCALLGVLWCRLGVLGGALEAPLVSPVRALEAPRAPEGAEKGIRAGPERAARRNARGRRKEGG